MGISKVILNGVTKVDLTQDTVDETNLLAGETATGADGEPVEGTIATKSSTNLTVSGATVTAPAGYYSAAASKSVATTTHPNPTASINSTTGVVTASHTQTTGYVTGGTTTGTLNLTTQAGKTVTPTETEQTAVAAGRYTTGAVKVGAISSTYIGSDIAQNDSDDLTVSGATVNVPAGYYAEAASKSVGTTTHPAPTASINSSTGLVTASHTQGTGYVTGGTTTGTLQITAQAAKTVTPTESEQTAVAAGRYTTGAVKVGAISSTYVGSGITQRDSDDLTASGATVTAPAGYYAEAASKSVASGTAGTPTATKGTVSNHSVSVTPSVTNTTGYITGGTKSGTAVTVSASELVSGTLSINSSGTKDVTNYASASVAAGTVATPTATKGTVSNHSVTVTPSVTNTAGYINGGTKTGTAVTVSVSELESGTKSITENGTGISVSGYSTVDVDVPSDEPVIQSLTVTPTTSQQVFTAGEEIGDQVYSQISFQSSPVQTFSTPLTVNDTYHIVVHGSTDDGRTFKTTPVDTIFKCKTTELTLNNVLTITNTGYTWTSHARSNYDALQVIINETTIVDGYSPVTVEACAPSVSVQPLSVTLNGTYTAPSGTAYSPVTVAVEGGGGGSVEEKQVNFVDYDGTILYSYTASEFANLSALPSNPGHAGLVSQGWNWTLAQIRSQLTAYPDAPVWVGQMYITQSGATEIDITLTAPNLHPYLQIAPKGTVVIDWGDNTATDTVTGTSNQSLKFTGHEYASAGNYTIKLTVSSGNFAFYTNSNTYRGVLSVKSDVTKSSLYADDITAIRIGENA